jgi:hypothetical protein
VSTKQMAKWRVRLLVSREMRADSALDVDRLLIEQCAARASQPGPDQIEPDLSAGTVTWLDPRVDLLMPESELESRVIEADALFAIVTVRGVRTT